MFTYYTLLVNSKLYFAEHLSTPSFLMQYMDQYKSLLTKYSIESNPLEVLHYIYIFEIAVYKIIKRFKIHIQDNVVRE